MKRVTLVIFAALSLAATSLLAQSQALRLDVPFDFVAGGKTLPAGQYIVESDRRGAVSIQSADFKDAVILVSYPAQDDRMNGVGAMRFRRYGTRYFLSQVWMGSEMGQALPKSRAEREQIASSGASHATVLITAQR